MRQDAIIAEGFEAAFERIHVERMDGVPILNPALSVAMAVFRPWGAGYIGVLVTPWFINAVLIGAQDDAGEAAPGTKKCFALPAGPFEFIRSQEQGLGGFWMCSLFSPVFEFPDQETALAVARAAFAALMDANGGEGEDDMERIWRGELPIADEAAPESPATEGFAISPSDGDDREEDGRRRTVSRRAFLTAGQARGDAP